MGSEPEPANILSQLIIIAILTLINAFFAASEMAIVSINKNKIKLLAEEGNKKARYLLKISKEPTKFLSTIQIGITLSGFFSSASAALGISNYLAQYLNIFKIPFSRQISIITVTLILSYITLVFGELFPKRLALQKSEEIAMFSIKPIIYISKIALPFIKLLTSSTNLLVRLFGLNNEGLDEKVSKEEIKSLVEVGQENGVINETEKEMINSIFEFDDKIANEVMTPSTDVYMINIEKPLTEYIDELINKKYSRIPVYEGNIDNIIGILYIKDFLAEARKKGFENVDIRSILHPAYFIPETKNIDELFKELQKSKNHIAVLITEYGSFEGIVSFEDLIEEVMGEIEDEYDNEEPEIKKLDINNYIVDGMIPLDDFNDYFHTKIESEDFDTIGGFIIDELGHIPINNKESEITYENLIFKIEKVKEKRIDKIKVTIKKNLK